MSGNAYTFIVKQGKTFSRRIEYKSNGQPFDLTGYEARMQIRPSFTSAQVYCNLSSSMGIDGTGINLTPTSASVVLPRASGSMSLNISAYSASQFSWQEGVYDLEIYSGSGVSEYVVEVLRGKIKVLNEVTR